MKCYHVHITGRVQGVGFRPYIYRLALQHKVTGWVSNTLDGVHLEVCGIKDINKFSQLILDKCPPQARIEELKSAEIVAGGFDRFTIRESQEMGQANMQLTPDFAICEDCLRELRQPDNRRFRYPFITCTNCGPRFSITRRLPYDRELTTMSPFQQCELCSAEFNDPDNRRFFSQTNSCEGCSIQLKLFDKRKKPISSDHQDIIEQIVKALLSGKIVAIKGIGGYLLCADATSEMSIQTLRKRKRRPRKPFALMYPDLEMAKQDVILTDKIIEQWKSPECPIVLCRLKKDFSSGIQHDLIAPGLLRMGIMLPYAPLFVLLMDKINNPIIATSGNVSGSPIIFKDEDALDILSEIADFIVVNNREIVVPQDDSVVQFTENSEQKIILRRSRGLAPSLELNTKDNPDHKILAMGAMLKSTFGLIHQKRYYISQFLGDTGTLESQVSYEATLDHMLRLLDFSPSTVIIDKHPEYPSSIYGRDIADKWNIPLIKVQHHEAHSYAVLAENELLNTENVLSVIWDGTGYGLDRQVWGGEFFEYCDHKHHRVGQWEYFPHILGDKMSLEPRLSAFCLTKDIMEAEPLLVGKFDPIAYNNYRILLNKGYLNTSSVGRIFDGVASILGITDHNTYEGEAAMYLEAVATEYLDGNTQFNSYYNVSILENGILKTQDLIKGIVIDMLKGFDKGYIAAKFHFSLVKVILSFLEKFNYHKVVFSGGVFQNNLLVDLVHTTLSDKYSVYFHKYLSPNDECIPFGQLIAWQILKE